MTKDVLVKLIDHGVDGLGLSLDGSTPERHDGVPGTFARTMQAIEWATDLNMPLQVNTLCAAETADDMPALFDLLKPHGITRWSLFFLISVGRGKVLEALPPEKAEALMSWIYETSKAAPFTVATIELMRADGLHGEDTNRTGDICPADFLPLTAGNIRKDQQAEVYRHSPLFEQLHDPSQFEGHFGVSRARAFGATGDPFASDPLCTYVPQVL